MLANMLKTYSSTETLHHSKWRVCSQASSSRTREQLTSNPNHKWSLYFRLETLGWNLCRIARERDPVQEPIINVSHISLYQEPGAPNVSLFGRRFDMQNFRNICCKISCLPQPVYRRPPSLRKNRVRRQRLLSRFFLRECGRLYTGQLASASPRIFEHLKNGMIAQFSRIFTLQSSPRIFGSLFSG